MPHVVCSWYIFRLAVRHSDVVIKLLVDNEVYILVNRGIDNRPAPVIPVVLRDIGPAPYEADTQRRLGDDHPLTDAKSVLGPLVLSKALEDLHVVPHIVERVRTTSRGTTLRKGEFIKRKPTRERNMIGIALPIVILDRSSCVHSIGISPMLPPDF